MNISQDIAGGYGWMLGGARGEKIFSQADAL